MKKLLTLISITTIVAAVTACSNPGAGDNDVLSATVEAQTSVAETSATTFDEPNKPEKITVEAYLNGEKIKIPVGGFPSYDSEEVEEYLHFAQRAVDLIVGLDNDFDSTIGEIKNGPSEYSDIEYPALRFNTDSYLSTISSITMLSDFSNNRGFFRVMVDTTFNNSEYRCAICVEFVKENGEWFVNGISDITLGL